MRWILFILLPLFNLFCQESLTAITENDPSSLVDGVSVITGDFYVGEEDYTIAGAEPIPIRRFYVSGTRGIDQYPHLTASFVLFTDTLFVCEPNGTPVMYSPEAGNNHGEIGDKFYGKNKKPLTYRSRDFANTSPGVSNTSTGTLSGKSQLKNQKIVFDPIKNSKGKSFFLYAADGTVRHYVNWGGQEKVKVGNYGKIYPGYSYKLLSETLPNGRVIHYEWDRKNRLLEIRTVNSHYNKTFARVKFPQLDLGKFPSEYSIWGSDGRSATYRYRKPKKEMAELAQIISPEQADQHLAYSKQNGMPRLTQISLPNGRTVVIQYDGSRVAALLAPIGPNNSLIPYYTFSYNPGAHTSSCTDACGNVTHYRWNHEYRLTCIERFEGGQCKNSEHFLWEGTNLRCKSVCDEKGAPIFAKTFDYDSQGNVEIECFWGNISGKGSPLHMGSNGMPLDDGVKKAVTRSKYNHRNLLVRREEPSGLITEYVYYDHAQLLFTKTISENGRFVSRTTYTYDGDNTLVQETFEDGSQVHKILETHPRQSDPYIALPDVIEEKYLENGTKKLLRKTKFHYTTGAFVEKKEIYDADGVLRYSLTYKPDSKGRLLEETNALGQTAVYGYDDVGNRTYIKDFSGRKESFYSYDLANRLIKKEEKGFDGLNEVYLYTYNGKNYLASETDAYDNKTLYENDFFGNKTETTLPTQELFGEAAKSPVLKSNFDGLGREILHIDAEQNQTKTTYTTQGKPILITHPDGAVEEHVYNLDGTLAVYINPLGIETKYKYDGLGRILEKKTDTAIETYVYDGSLLVEKTDAEGTKTLYHYDGAGRKISEEVQDEIVKFTYDNLGRIASRIEGNLITLYEYDLLDRLKEEKKISDAGVVQQTIEYDYDSSGNISRITKGLNNTELLEYDSFNRLIRKTDSTGSVETTKYDKTRNNLDQKVLRKTITDPLGLQTIKIHDAQDRISQIEKSYGDPLLIEDFYYNLNGLKTAQQELIYNPDRSSRTIINRWEYDNRSRIKTLTEGNGAKTTTYQYDLQGNKKTVTKPDGTSLFYEYNPLGYLDHLYSSDGTVNHCPVFDRVGRLTAFDGIKRELDHRGRILSETFPNGAFVKSRYDTRGRRFELTISPFNLLVEYQHGPLYLKQIHFQNKTHAYTEYDLAGNLLQETLFNSDILVHTYESSYRPKSLESSSFHQQIEEYDLAGNILRMSVDGVSCTYTYDPLYQLTSEKGVFQHNYLYDALYNRICKDTELYSINALNQIPTHCLYDLNGNVSHIDSFRLTYDALDRLIRVESPDTIQTFTYDYLNRCLTKTIQGQQPLHYLYDGQNEIGSFDNTLRDFRVLGKTETAEIGAAVAILLNDELYAPIHDLQGNIATLVSLAQEALSNYRYSAFGEEKTEGSALSPWRFSSKRIDPLTGFVNYGRRYYMPTLGRWLTPDPLGFNAGMNMYAFVNNDPLTHLDEYGLWSKPNEKESTWPSFPSHCFHQTWRELMGPIASEIAKFTHYVNLSNRPFNSADFMQRGHQTIDWMFGTQLTSAYKADRPQIGTYSVLPSPFFSTNYSMIPSASKTQSIARNYLPSMTKGGVRPITQANETILFGQKSVSAYFSKEGVFKSKPISEIVKGLRNGTISPRELPINIISHKGKKITLNNRSLLALRRAGIEPQIIIDKTGVQKYELVLKDHLREHSPSDVIKIRGGPPGTSFIGSLD